MTFSRVRRRGRTAGVTRLGGAAAVVTVTAASLLLAVPAAADDATYEQATWYYDNFNMAANLATANGTGVTIAVIDGSIDPSVPELAGAKISVQEPSQCLLNGSTDPVSTGAEAEHGTEVAVMVAGNGTGTWDGRGGKGIAPGADILYYRNQTDRSDGQSGTQCHDALGDDLFDTATANAIQDATAKGARVISMSFIADQNMAATSVAMGSAERKGIVFVAGTDDKSPPYSDERISPPGIFNGAVLVNASTAQSTVASTSSLSPLVAFASPGESVCLGGFNPANGGAWDSRGVTGGSSFATPWTAGVIADAMSRYPQATGNQILQLMIRTTGGTFAEPVTRGTDGFGFGTPSLTTMLEHDPSAYPDVNPLLRDGVDPPTSEILGQTTAPSSSAAPSSAAPDPGSGTAGPTTQAAARDDGGSSLPLILGIVAAGVVVLAVLVLLLVRRARRRPPPGGPPGPGSGSAGPSPYPPPPYGQPAG